MEVPPDGEITLSFSSPVDLELLEKALAVRTRELKGGALKGGARESHTRTLLLLFSQLSTRPLFPNLALCSTARLFVCLLTCVLISGLLELNF